MWEQILVGLIGVFALLIALRTLAPAAWLARHAEALARRLDGGATRVLARLLRAWAPAPGGGCGGCGGACAATPEAGMAQSAGSNGGPATVGDAPPVSRASAPAPPVSRASAPAVPQGAGDVVAAAQVSEPAVVSHPIRVLRRTSGHILREVPLGGPRSRN